MILIGLLQNDLTVGQMVDVKKNMNWNGFSLSHVILQLKLKGRDIK